MIIYKNKDNSFILDIYLMPRFKSKVKDFKGEHYFNIYCAKIDQETFDNKFIKLNKDDQLVLEHNNISIGDFFEYTIKTGICNQFSTKDSAYFKIVYKTEDSIQLKFFKDINLKEV